MASMRSTGSGRHRTRTPGRREGATLAQAGGLTLVAPPTGSDTYAPAGHARIPERWRRRAFAGPPPSPRQLAEALLEPLVAVLTWIALRMTWPAQDVGALPAFGLGLADAGLCLGVAALSFPGRMHDSLPGGRPSPLEVGLGWAWRLGMLGLIGALLGVLDGFPTATLTTWALVTPALQYAALAAWSAQARQARRAPAERRRAVIVGAGPVATRLRRALREAEGDAIEWLGCFDDRGSPVEATGAPTGGTGPTLGGLAQAAEWVRRHEVREVYITLPMGMQPRIVELLQALQDTTVSLYVVPDVFGATVVQGRLLDVAGVPVVGLCETPFTGVNAVLKRAEDLLLGSLILLAVAPVMAAVALGVRLSSPGPVLFRQRRHGLDGREIEVWKFRSMRVMEDGDVVRQATRDDPRVTRFGAFIRRTSLDELPQFLNVLQGTMSVVGPRPHALAHNRAYAELIRTYMVRHKVKPGITGWAQVNGHRGETDTVEKMRARLECDLEYLRHWSLALDLRIVARTVALVFTDRKAY